MSVIYPPSLVSFLLYPHSIHSILLSQHPLKSAFPGKYFCASNEYKLAHCRFAIIPTLSAKICVWYIAVGRGCGCSWPTWMVTHLPREFLALSYSYFSACEILVHNCVWASQRLSFVTIYASFVIFNILSGFAGLALQS